MNPLLIKFLTNHERSLSKRVLAEVLGYFLDDDDREVDAETMNVDKMISKLNEKLKELLNCKYKPIKSTYAVDNAWTLIIKDSR